MTPAKDRVTAAPDGTTTFAVYCRHYNDFAQSQGEYTRPKNLPNGQVNTWPGAVRAERITAERHLVGLAVSRGPVRAHEIHRALVLANGDVTAPDVVASVIVSDGDVRVSRSLRSLVIARGDITVESADGSRFVAGGTLTVGKYPLPPMLPKDVETNYEVKKYWERLVADFEPRQVIMQEKEPNPLGFVTFFELHRIGLEVRAAAGSVTVSGVKAGSPAAGAGLRVGDVFTGVGGQAPADAEALRRLLRDALAVGEAAVTVRRGRGAVAVKIALPD